jgi:hypothetical protein
VSGTEFDGLDDYLAAFDPGAQCGEYWSPARMDELAGQCWRRDFPHNMLGGTPEPGPPYTHTLTGPRPVLARNGKPLYWPPVRPYTMTIRGES